MTAKEYNNLIKCAAKAQEKADSLMNKILGQLHKDGLDERFGIQDVAGDGFTIYDDDSLYGVSYVIASLVELGYFDGRGGI